MNKQLILNDVPIVINLIRKIGIKTPTFYMIGHLDEEIEDIIKTIEFACKNRADRTYLYLTVPLPGTELFRIAKKEGLIKEEISKDCLKFGNYCYKLSKVPKNKLEFLREYAYRKINDKRIII